MEIKTKRYLLFLIGCIGSRLFLTYLAKNLQDNNLNILSIITLLIGISFLYIYFIGSSRADKQLEWVGEKKIWWNDLRIVHGSIYLLFSLMAFNNINNAWYILLIDTLIGLISWLKHHKFV
jgi:hypothetical protein